ncbi:hypothetical protein Val02_76120 [Virgisporangium aliadipatigenens]|uniref:Gala protein n=1 Tax=Virgisporangium aliadipatigenens TaxID=741659 RepID=A0A8J4DUT2_9ACTN|nr:gala protein [Virgisporangium aliadipatigenens]GIJ50726.1 hypothetical protein Val02_76120 [Virgisporangium aliadipatigenens]
MSAWGGSEPTAIRCGTDRFPVTERGDALVPLLERLADPRPVAQAEEYPTGTLQADGRLDLCKQGLGPDGLARVLPAAVGSPNVRHLLLGTNTLGADGARALAAALPEKHGVETLYLGCNRIDAEGARPLLERLADDGTVRALWLKRNPLGDPGALLVARALRANPALRTLDLVNTGLTTNGLRALVDVVVAREAPLDRLFLGGNGLGTDAVPALVRLLRDGGVRELYLAVNRLGDDGAAGLAEAVRDLDGVVLGLGGNGIGPAGVAALAGALGGLHTLDLGRPPSERALGGTPNTVGDEGARTLAEALPGSPLRRLDLRQTGVTSRGAKALLAAVEGGTRLEFLALGAGVARRVKRGIAAALHPASGPHPDIRAIASVYR